MRVLPSGWDVKFSTPQQMAQSVELVAVSLRQIAAGLQIPEFLLSGDMRGVNYSSARTALVQFRAHARRFDLTRRLIINDDLGLFANVTRELGEAAAATEADLCAQQLLGDDTLSDGIPLLHASRANIVTATGGDLIADLSAARLALRRQKAMDGVTPIAVTPRYVVAGPEMETALEKALAAIHPGDADSVNPFAGRLQLLIDPRIEDADWFVFADPNRAAVFNLAHLAAGPGPQIQRQEAWDTLGVSFRCFMDVGAGFAGWRGAVKVANG